jgi:tetratricopeptide (TPR) repeat protein
MTMTPPGMIDASGESTRAAAEAQAALAAGNTERAAVLFKSAAELLEARIANARKQSDKHLLRFLAASQYYHGGLYPRAQELSRKIEARLLPPETRAVFENYVRDLRDRSASDYGLRMRTAFARAWKDENYQKVLSLLQDHPYVLPPAKMAYFRALCCRSLGESRAAILFFEDALRFAPEDLDLIHAAGSNALVLAGQDRLADAWTHIRHQLDSTGHVFPTIIASLIRSFQARVAESEAEKQELLREQIKYFEKAWNLYHQLPAKHQDDPDTRKLIELALEAAALGMWRLGDKAESRRLSEQFIAFAPTAYAPRTVRGVINYPSDKALQDFRVAIERGDPSYQPYYYLAHEALTRGDYISAATWSEASLRHRPSNPIKAQLLEWLAIARSYLGQDPKEIEKLFVQAQELDPRNARVAHNAAVFQSMSAAPLIPHQQWDLGDIQNGRDHYAAIAERDLQLLGGGEHFWSGERELLKV